MLQRILSPQQCFDHFFTISRSLHIEKCTIKGCLTKRRKETINELSYRDVNQLNFLRNIAIFVNKMQHNVMSNDECNIKDNCFAHQTMESVNRLGQGLASYVILMTSDNVLGKCCD